MEIRESKRLGPNPKMKEKFTEIGQAEKTGKTSISKINAYT